MFCFSDRHSQSFDLVANQQWSGYSHQFLDSPHNLIEIVFNLPDSIFQGNTESFISLKVQNASSSTGLASVNLARIGFHVAFILLKKQLEEALTINVQETLMTPARFDMNKGYEAFKIKMIL